MINNHIKKVYIPMTETAFYILLCLTDAHHGYEIAQNIKKLTADEVIIGPGTLYGSLSKMEKDGLISMEKVIDRRKYYKITELGKEVLQIEIKRIHRLHKNMKEILACKHRDMED